MSVDCLYVTLNSGEMKQHVINHLGSKGSLQCAFCPKGATDADDLIEHLLETHKEDMYQCQCCFYNNEDWKTIADHRKTHSKEDAEKPFFVIKKC